MLLVGKNMDLVKKVKIQLSSKFEMKDIGPTHSIPRMDIRRTR